MLKFLLIIPALLMIGLFSGCETTDADALKKATDKAKTLEGQLTAEKAKAKDLQTRLTAAEKAKAQKSADDEEEVPVDPQKGKGPKGPKDGKDGKAGVPDPDDDGEQVKVVKPVVVPDETMIAGVKVMKFEYPAVKPLEKAEHALKLKAVTDAIANLDFTKKADVVKGKITALKAAVDAIDEADINAVDKDNKNASLLYVIMKSLFPLVKKDKLEEAKVIRTNALLPLLAKKANPALQGPDDKPLLKTDEAKATHPLLVKTIEFFEPNQSAAEALVEINKKIAGAGDDDAVKEGKQAVADLKQLDPYMQSQKLKALAAKVATHFAKDDLSLVDVKKADDPAALDAFVSGTLEDKKDADITKLPLQDAISALLFFSGK